jgi:hypothetical protein
MPSNDQHTPTEAEPQPPLKASEAWVSCPREESIVAFCANQTRGRAYTNISRHLEGCTACRDEVTALSEALHEKMGLPLIELPPFRGG